MWVNMTKTKVRLLKIYNIRRLAGADAIMQAVKDFKRGELPEDEFLKAIIGAALQEREDGEDVAAILNGQASGHEPMYFGCWEK